MRKSNTIQAKKAGKSKSEPSFDQGKEVRAIARERVGPVKAARVLVPKKLRKKPKHKKPPDQPEE